MPDYDRRRSRSPNHSSRRHRSRSPAHRRPDREREPRRSQHHSSSRSHHKPDSSLSKEPVKLPLNARQLTKHDLPVFRAMFGLYLDLQKNKDIDELSSDEIKGRWKSFIGKWNRGELAEGWYDPTTKTKADNSAIATDRTAHKDGLEMPFSASSLPKDQPASKSENNEDNNDSDNDEDDDDDDEYGPSLPSDIQRGIRAPGPVIPSLEDLQHRNEMTLEEAQAYREDLRYERKIDRRAQKERLEDLVPRADPGTRERLLEKKQEASAANRAFREARSPGAEEVGEKDLMGDDEDGIKRKIKEMDKKKSERELRKEEVLRAREAEREERLAGLRAKEDKTMEVLRAIARERFGANC